MFKKTNLLSRLITPRMRLSTIHSIIQKKVGYKVSRFDMLYNIDGNELINFRIFNECNKYRIIPFEDSAGLVELLKDELSSSMEKNHYLDAFIIKYVKDTNQPCESKVYFTDENGKKLFNTNTF